MHFLPAEPPAETHRLPGPPQSEFAEQLLPNAPVFAKESVLNKQSSEELEQWLENLKPEDFGKLDQ